MTKYIVEMNEGIIIGAKDGMNNGVMLINPDNSFEIYTGNSTQGLPIKVIGELIRNGLSAEEIIKMHKEGVIL